MLHRLHKIIGKLFQKDNKISHPVTIDPKPPRSTLLEFDRIINKYIPYYNKLGEESKKRFITRCWNFRGSKEFYFVSMKGDPEIPILVSAAATQLTFGLDDYKLGFFKKIYVMPDAYDMGNQQALFIGHVSPEGIFLSWKHFLQGYADQSDNINVAIHEMAHAVAYHHFLEGDSVNAEFREDFEKLPPVFGPAIADKIVRRRCYLRPYAFTNIQEFWAVSVEAFFENPSGLKDNMPHLYSVISEILNQDLQADQRISTSIASGPTGSSVAN